MIFLASFLLLNVPMIFANFHNEEVVVRVVGGLEMIKELADEAGYIFKGSVRGFKDTYIILPRNDKNSEYDKRDGNNVRHRLEDDNRVIWIEKQLVKTRHKRDYRYLDDFLENLVGENEFQRIKSRNSERAFNDVLWSQQWYLQDTRTRSDLPKLDLNVIPVYKAGITGKGIRVNILDDGIEYTHDDLKINYDPEISYDCNEDDDDPLPRYDRSKANSHGTRCAGEIAMVANNFKCGVGIAFNAKVGGVKILDGPINDRIEGTALSYGLNLVDIYSASWGPSDDGETVDGPGRLALEALENGVNEGRNGKGAIYVWASGNGGSQHDNCNCDGYLTSIYTISIGSASQKGEFPWYGEECASTLAVTYSSGAYRDQMIATTDLFNECTIKHTGTSASAPLAAGIIALALEANPNLTWRDVQHLIVWTSEPAPVSDNPGWQQNAAGFWFNTRFGFGLMNAYGMVVAASNWTIVPEKFVCAHAINLPNNASFSFENPIVVPFTSDGCKGSINEIQLLEHVEVQMSISYNVRGVLELNLTSPSGTTVQLLSPRDHDKNPFGFHKWTFMSVMTWGEKPNGLWKIIVSDKIGPSGNSGEVTHVMVRLHGTKTRPNYMSGGPRNYNREYNRIKNHVNQVNLNSINPMVENRNSIQKYKYLL